MTHSVTSTRPSAPESFTMSNSSFDSSESRSQTPLLGASNLETTQTTRTLNRSVEIIPSHLPLPCHPPILLLPSRGFGSGALKPEFAGLGFSFNFWILLPYACESHAECPNHPLPVGYFESVQVEPRSHFPGLVARHSSFNVHRSHGQHRDPDSTPRSRVRSSVLFLFLSFPLPTLRPKSRKNRNLHLLQCELWEGKSEEWFSDFFR